MVSSWQSSQDEVFVGKKQCWNKVHCDSWNKIFFGLIFGEWFTKSTTLVRFEKILYFIICFLSIWCFKSSLMFLVSFFQHLYHHSTDYTSKVCAPFQPKQDKLGVACHRGNCQNNSVEVWRGQLAGSTTPASACANFCWAWDFLGER